MTLRTSVDGPVATITIDNPAKRNAMTAQMWRSLPTLLKEFQNHSLVRVVVLTGAEGTFSAGAAITWAGAKQRAASPPKEPPTVPDHLANEDPSLPDDLIPDAGGSDALEVANLTVLAEEALAAFPKPTIARIEGDCVGGGCQLALACDLRLASPGARFGVTPARLGVVYPAASTARLVDTVGLAGAKWLLLTGDLIPAEQAWRLGLVHEVASDLDARVAALTATLASRSLLSQAAAKEIMAMSAYGVDAARVHHWMNLMRDSGEAAEGAAAFLDRREPNFPWKP
ncbi:MAG TPA: enoyl-CoA hydratase/isomerase family protein [Candidatus Limnocylindrales bacterium]|nr:enoyl-CoA hydratase/isomerase family protein [Candidatus Limnocylindrales bacterium]